MKRTVTGSEVLLWVLCVASAIAAITSVTLALVYSSEHNFLYVPFASWFVLGLSGLILTLDGIALYFWRRFCKTRKDLVETNQELVDLREQPLEDEIPAVCGHKHLDKAEFMAIIQILFRHPPDIKYIHVKPLPGGYGGSTTVLAKLQRERSDTPLPRSFVVKLGDRREMADEHDKYQEHVQWRLPRAARFFRYAEWDDLAGIAYEFVGLDPDHEVQSFYQFYQGHAAVEVSELIGRIYSHLGRAWYRKGKETSANLYHEYGLLSKKQNDIIKSVGKIVDQDDPYRDNFTSIERELRHKLKPRFCPEIDIPWHDPVAFLQTWPWQNPDVPIYRSIVHGDLHARNILVEIGRDGQKHAWFIDFSHSGNGLSQARTEEASREGTLIDPGTGHTLRDFCRLEADVKFVLTKLCDENDLGLAVAFEKELLTCGMAMRDLQVEPPHAEALMDERFKKAWQVIREIRRQADEYLINKGDLRPYCLSLLHATLPIVYYHPGQFENEPCERQQKRYALLSAGMLCSKL